MPIKLGINGFGRIGRSFYRAALKHGHNFEVVAANDITDSETLAHLLKYDSVYGRLNSEVNPTSDSILVDGKELKILSHRDPGELPWKKLDISIVVESTGLFTDREQASKHLKAGARKVIVSAPTKGPDITIVPGVNDDKYDSEKHHIVSLASCTTNCVAPVAKVLHDTFRIRHGFMTTAHAYTNDQRILDLPHKDLRRARAAAVSIIPTTTGAAIATTEVLPELRGKLHGISLRVPVPDGSITDLVTEVERDATVESVNKAFKEAADGPLKGILAYSEEPLVSVDVIGDPHSAIVDGLCTMVLESRLVKVLAWYDNEWAYSNRLVEMANTIATSI